MRMLQRWQWQHFVLKSQVLADFFGASCTRRCPPPAFSSATAAARRTGVVQGTREVSATLTGSAELTSTKLPCLPLEKRHHQQFHEFLPAGMRRRLRAARFPPRVWGGCRRWLRLLSGESQQSPSKGGQEIPKSLSRRPPGLSTAGAHRSPPHLHGC